MMGPSCTTWRLAKLEQQPRDICNVLAFNVELFNLLFSLGQTNMVNFHVTTHILAFL